MIILLVLLINFLVSVRGYLQRKHQLEKVKGKQKSPCVYTKCTDSHPADIAKALYPDHGHLAVRFLELRQHVGLNLVEVSWFAFLEPEGAKGLKRHSLQTRELALTRNKALKKLQKKLVKDLVKKMTDSPAAGAAIEAAI